MKSDIDFEEIIAESDDGKVRVVLDFCGEGHNGDYNPDDSTDEPLLRFDVFRKFEERDRGDNSFANCEEVEDAEPGDWLFVRKASFCTGLTANDDREILQRAARHMLAATHPLVVSGGSIKSACERFSWLSASDFGSPATAGST